MTMSQNPAVRNFANLLIADHTRLGQAVAAAAMAGGVTPPPPALLPPQQTALDQLRAASPGPGFDMAFRDAQIAAHQQALTLMQNYATSGDIPQLRAAAAQAIPTIQMHLAQAQALAVAPPPPPPPAMPPAGERGERG
jgi:putative membrane protein